MKKRILIVDDERWFTNLLKYSIEAEGYYDVRQENDAADIRMRRQRLHHVQGVVVGIAAGKTDQLHPRIIDPVNDPTRDMVRALHKINHYDGVADALSAILT